MSNSIVTVNVTQQVAPTPTTLQKFGAFISQGATSTSPNTSSLLTQLSDLTPLLTGAKAITSMVLTSGVVTVTATAAHGFTVGDTLYITIAGVTPAAYNGIFLATVTTTTAFTYPLTGSPGSVTIQGMYTPEDVAELLQMATTFFSQSSNQSVYVLELGPGNPNDGVAALSAYITANPNSAYTPGALGFYYSYLVPRTWDGNANFLSLLATFNSTTAKTYFIVTTTLATYTLYTILNKCVLTVIECPQTGVYASNALTAIAYSSGSVSATTTTAHGVVPGNWFTIQGVTPSGYNGTFLAQPGTTGSTLIYNLSANPGTETVLGILAPSYYAQSGVSNLEFSAAAIHYCTLNYAPSSTNRVAPLAFQFVTGVTPFPTRGNSALLSILKNAYVNVIGTGAQGGISQAIILWGTTMDGSQYAYWYSVDWVQLNVNLNIANAVINGSNNPTNPLYYNQAGINRLLAIAVQTIQNGVAFGLVLFPPTQTALDGPVLVQNLDAGTYNGMSVVNAVPFVTYSQENPGDYKIGRYAGFTIIYTPQLGFTNIIFNVLVSSFVAGF